MHLRNWKSAALYAILVAFLLVLVSRPAAAQGAILFQDFFSTYSNGILTNEYAFNHPSDPNAHSTPNWEMTSGSLFVSGGAGYTGIPDSNTVDVDSAIGNNSTVFRCRSKQSNFGDVQMAVNIYNYGLVTTPGTPSQSYDGIHLWLRYITDEHLYAITINRRDNVAVIKKKIPGGPSNGGTYYTLKSVNYTYPLNAWQSFTASAKNNIDNSVTITLSNATTTIATVTDNGSIGGAPITVAGKIGIRGDNCRFKFDSVVVRTLP